MNEPSDKKRKIIFLITKSNFGGAQRYVYDLATNLPTTTYDITVVFGGEGTLKEKLTEKNIRTLSLPRLTRDVHFFDECKIFFDIIKLLALEKPAILHLNSSKISGLSALAGRLYNTYYKTLRALKVQSAQHWHPVHIIFTAHGWPFKEKRRSFVKVIIAFLSWLTLILSHKTIVVSADDLEKISHFPWVKKKIILIRNGISTPSFLSREDARKTLNSLISKPDSPDTVWIGSVAELHKNKGISYAIDALYLLATEKTTRKINPQKIKYLIIGGGEEAQTLGTLIDERQLHEHVFLLGEQANASRFMNAFDIFLIPSLKEGLPYVLLEAGCAGLPTVATNVGGIPEIIEDMENGIIVKAKRPKEIAEALSYLLINGEKRKLFATALHHTVTSTYDIHRMLEETFALYK